MAPQDPARLLLGDTGPLTSAELGCALAQVGHALVARQQFFGLVGGGLVVEGLEEGPGEDLALALGEVAELAEAVEDCAEVAPAEPAAEDDAEVVGVEPGSPAAVGGQAVLGPRRPLGPPKA
jgi:hypothetical protein